MEVVNAVYRGVLETKVDLAQVHKNLPNSVFHTSKPLMVVKKDTDGTIMIFASGKFRIMGITDELEATFKVMAIFEKLGLEVSMITIQTMTVKLKLGRIDLTKLSGLIKSTYDLEIFPALMVTKYKPVSVNVFSTGTVMICGVKSLDMVNEIEHDLKILL
jgi:TATA-box binding protein (TBP) (component of TFIID and TFIIIB)